MFFLVTNHALGLRTECICHADWVRALESAIHPSENTGDALCSMWRPSRKGRDWIGRFSATKYRRG